MNGPGFASVKELVTAKDVLVVCGSGGVGKTTCAAALAVAAAVNSERKVLVVTIDPARRLADALNLEIAGNKIVEVPLADVVDEHVRGRLFAGMIDTKQSWDDLVHRHAPDIATANAILASPLYRNISERFVQSHDYIAMERLHELYEIDEYDLIVVDTPPSTHAVDFLDAPERMASFFDSRLLKFLVAPSRSRLMSLTARPFLQLADRILGKRFLADITQFFTMLESMRPGFIARANATQALLRSPECSFVTVTTMESAAAHEAQRFVEELRRRHLDLGLVVRNRALPATLKDEKTQKVANDLTDPSPELVEQLARLSGQDSERVGRVLAAAGMNFVRFGHLSAGRTGGADASSATPTLAVDVPWFGDLSADVSGLLRVGGIIWS